jgi:tetratricopeptide (TPR) repeat protein
MLRKGLILLAVSLTVSLAGAQVDYLPGQDVRNQQQLPINPGRRTNAPIPLGQDSAVSATSLAAPKDARAAYDKALKEIDKGRSANLDKARQYLEKAVEEYPEYAAAWTKLGQVKADTGDPDGAIVALEKSVKLDERYLPPYDALVWLYMGKGDWDHATELTKFVLDINPTVTKMRWYQAGCAYESGRDDEALALFREIQNDAEAAKQFPQTHLFMGLIYARRGQLAKAAAGYNLYLELVPNAPDAEAVKKQLNEWQQLGVI